MPAGRFTHGIAVFTVRMLFDSVRNIHATKRNEVTMSNMRCHTCASNSAARGSSSSPAWSKASGVSGCGVPRACAPGGAPSCREAPTATVLRLDRTAVLLASGDLVPNRGDINHEAFDRNTVTCSMSDTMHNLHA